MPRQESVEKLKDRIEELEAENRPCKTKSIPLRTSFPEKMMRTTTGKTKASLRCGLA